MQIAVERSHPPLRTVTPDCIPELFSCNKSNTTTRAVLFIVPQNYYCYIVCSNTSTLLKEGRNLGAGFNNIQRRRDLDGQTLTTLGTTTCENGTTAFGGHTGAETMALSTLALIRLVGALHSKTLSNCV